MRRFQRVLFIAILLVIIAFTLTFILENQTKVNIFFLTYETPAISLALIVISAFIIGMLVAMIINAFVLMRIKLKLAIAKKQLTTYQKESALKNTTLTNTTS